MPRLYRRIVRLCVVGERSSRSLTSPRRALWSVGAEHLHAYRWVRLGRGRGVARAAVQPPLKLSDPLLLTSHTRFQPADLPIHPQKNRHHDLTALVIDHHPLSALHSRVVRTTVIKYALILVGLVSVVSAASVASASAVTAQAGYECRSPQANMASPPPPLEENGSVVTAPASDHLTALCSGGELPYPIPTGGVGYKTSPPRGTEVAGGLSSTMTGRVAVRAPQRQASASVLAGAQRSIRARTGSLASSYVCVHHRSDRDRGCARAARQKVSDEWYSWAHASQEPKTGYAYLVVLKQTNQQPNVYVTYSHSIGQLWDVDSRTPNGEPSTAETGWIEAPGQYPDVDTHLFAAMSDCGVYPDGGYVGLSGISWVQESSMVVPNMVLAVNSVHVYAVELYEGNMWFDYDGNWYGYIPGGAWGCRIPLGQDIQFGGEVETPELETCTDMGNGLLGTQAESATVVESSYSNAGYSGRTTLTEGFMSDPLEYNLGQWVPSKGAYSFHYGGPGWC